jgi:hypothetical protein
MYVFDYLKEYLQKRFEPFFINYISSRLIKTQVNIFNKYINNKYKIIPFNIKVNNVGATKYLPAASKEWRNSIYFYNSNYLKDLPIYDVNLNKLIKGYFNLYFMNRFIKNKYISSRLKRLSLYKIYVSRAEIKHTSSKAVITIYTYNKENISLKNKIKILNPYSFHKKWNKWILNKRSFLYKIFHLLHLNKKSLYNVPSNDYNKIVKFMFYNKLSLLRRYKLRLNLNDYKFKDVFLHKLSLLISKFYNKKVEFNIVKLKSIVFNPDIFTEVLKLKLKRRRINVIKVMNFILSKVNLPKVNRIRERASLTRNVDINLLENKYNNLSLNSIINNNNLEKVLSELYNNSFNKIDYGKDNLDVKNIILNSVKYKNIGGIRLEIKGRLTKRYRADRSIFKVRWKGGLKNIDSSYKGLSSPKLRGYGNSNVEYSLCTSKRRIGSFAIKGWISGK